MMDYIIYIIKIALYFVLAEFLCKVIQKKDILPLYLVKAMFVGLLFAVYSGFVMSKSELDGDKAFYAMAFSEGWYVADTESVGLNFVFELLREYTLNPYMMFAFFSFANIFIGLMAYKISRQSNALSLRYMMISYFPLIGFYAYKQCIADAFLYCSYAVFLNTYIFKASSQKLFCFLFTIGFLILSICFHRSAYFMVGVLTLCILYRIKSFHRIINIGLLLLPFVFLILQSYVFANLNSINENLANRSESYSDSAGLASNFFVVLKALPFITVAYVGTKMKPNLERKIANYDVFLLLTYFTVEFSVLAIYSYWYNRFVWYLYFPVFVFTSLLARENIRIRIFGTPWNKVFYYMTVLFTLILISEYYFLYGGL